MEITNDKKLLLILGALNDYKNSCPSVIDKKTLEIINKIRKDIINDLHDRGVI